TSVSEQLPLKKRQNALHFARLVQEPVGFCPHSNRFLNKSIFKVRFNAPSVNFSAAQRAPFAGGGSFTAA
ncbi:MAG: hypothetical protein LBD86_07820, partial [Spirochaetaceae bacterium]|nr:hypothetical protein [Spirochaetaceae bacterium]